jgi:hypothetical protein
VFVRLLRRKRRGRTAAQGRGEKAWQNKKGGRIAGDGSS